MTVTLRFSTIAYLCIICGSIGAGIVTARSARDDGAYVGIVPWEAIDDLLAASTANAEQLGMRWSGRITRSWQAVEHTVPADGRDSCPGCACRQASALLCRVCRIFRKTFAQARISAISAFRLPGGMALLMGTGVPPALWIASVVTRCCTEFLRTIATKSPLPTTSSINACASLMDHPSNFDPASATNVPSSHAHLTTTSSGACCA